MTYQIKIEVWTIRTKAAHTARMTRRLAVETLACKTSRHGSSITTAKLMASVQLGLIHSS